MIKGKVIKGEGIARDFNYPTANIGVDWESFSWETGVYAGMVKLLGEEYGAAVVIKKNPDKVETHLIGYSGEDFYGEEIEVSDIRKVSEIRALAGQSLRDKIEADMEKVKKALFINE